MLHFAFSKQKEPRKFESLIFMIILQRLDGG